MASPVTAPYLATLSIITVRWFKAGSRPPAPAALIGATVIFGGVSLIADSQEKFARALAWSFFAGSVVALWALPANQRNLVIAGIPPLTANQTSELIGGATGGPVANGTTGKNVPPTQKHNDGTPVSPGVGSIQGFVNNLTGNGSTS